MISRLTCDSVSNEVQVDASEGRLSPAAAKVPWDGVVRADIERRWVVYLGAGFLGSVLPRRLRTASPPNRQWANDCSAITRVGVRGSTNRTCGLTVGALAICMLGIPASGIAQEAPPAVAAPTQAEPGEPATQGLLEATQADLAQLADDTTLDEGSRTEATRLLQETITALESAIAEEAAAGQFKAEATTAPEETRALRKSLEELPGRDKPFSRDDLKPETRALDADELDQLIESDRLEVAEQAAALTTLKDEILREEGDRLSQLEAEESTATNRLREAQRELDALAPPEGQLQTLAKGRLEAEVLAARASQDRLQAEKNSHRLRLDRKMAERDLLEARYDRANSRLLVLDQLLVQRRNEMAEESMLAAEAITAGKNALPDTLQELADELKALSAEYQEVVKQLGELTEDRAEANERYSLLEATYEDIREQFAVGGSTGAFSRILMEQWRSLPRPHESRLRENRLNRAYAEARARTFEVNDRIRRLDNDLRETREALLLELETLGLDEEEEQTLMERADQLQDQRTRILTDLRNTRNSVVQGTLQQQTTEQRYQDLLQETRDFLGEKLFWVPSSPPVGINTAQQLPDAIRSLAPLNELRQLLHYLVSIPMRMPLVVLIAVLLWSGLVLLRPRLIHRLGDMNGIVGKIGREGDERRDSWKLTFAALGYSALLAAPWPLLLIVFGWGGMTQVESSWFASIGFAALFVAVTLYPLLVLSELARPSGLADLHFGWDEIKLEQLRKKIRLFLIGYMPQMFLVQMILYRGEPTHMDSLGRLLFVTTLLWAAWVLRRALHPETGIFARALDEEEGRPVSTLSIYWYPILVMVPVALGVLALFGYVLTGLALLGVARIVLWWIAGGILVYQLLLRWFTIRERRLQLEQRLREYRLRRETQSEAPAPETPEEIINLVKEDKIDLVRVGEQMRRILRFVVGAVVAVGVWFACSGAIPAFQYLDTYKLFDLVSVSDLLVGIIIIIATFVCARNLPGLFEILLLQRLKLDSGSRNAISTLGSYAVVAIGATLTFSAMEMDWSRFGWIAAALSVGLGFGLQEVVANFVCGIIVLFERPIRVGDVVTVNGVDGVVSRIQIRATTITDWDRKEFVVPNKEFVTGTLKNWTLSSSVSRIVIPIGVAYGSDTELTYRSLKDVIESHPEIMEDPAPLITFEGFGASSLDFVVRCYQPSLEKRIQTIHELHMQIDQRFRDEGIEIAFPQQDIHIRNVPENLLEALQVRNAREDGAKEG